MNIARLRRTIRRKWYAQPRGRLIALCMLAVVLYLATIDRLAPCPPAVAQVSVTPIPLAASVTAGVAVPASDQVDTTVPYYEIFNREGARVDIPPKLLARWGWWESALDPRAVSRDGYASRGIGQFIRSTWAENAAKYGYSWDDAFDPEKNIRVMADYLAYLRAYVAKPGMSEREIVHRMLVGYNAGPGHVDRYGTGNMPARSRQAIADTLAYAGY